MLQIVKTDLNGSGENVTTVMYTHTHRHRSKDKYRKGNKSLKDSEGGDRKREVIKAEDETQTGISSKQDGKKETGSQTRKLRKMKDKKFTERLMIGNELTCRTHEQRTEEER